MTVQELIDILLKIEDKSKNVWVECYDWVDGSCIENALIVYSLDNLPNNNRIYISNDLENEQKEDKRIVYGEYRKAGMTENPKRPQSLTIDEKRAWLARIFRDTTGEYTDADKFKAMREDTRLLELNRLITRKE